MVCCSILYTVFFGAQCILRGLLHSEQQKFIATKSKLMLETDWSLVLKPLYNRIPTKNAVTSHQFLNQVPGLSRGSKYKIFEVSLVPKTVQGMFCSDRRP